MKWSSLETPEQKEQRHCDHICRQWGMAPLDEVEYWIEDLSRFHPWILPFYRNNRPLVLSAIYKTISNPPLFTNLLSILNSAIRLGLPNEDIDKFTFSE